MCSGRRTGASLHQRRKHTGSDQNGKYQTGVEGPDVAFNKQIGLGGIIDAYKQGCRNFHEMADHLDVTEEFLKDALEAYRSKYGHYVIVDNYTIYFEPYLSVADMNVGIYFFYTVYLYKIYYIKIK